MIRVQIRRKETVERGQALYDSTIRHEVEPVHHGAFLALDVQTGDYEIDANMLMALDRLGLRRPTAEPYVVRIGHPTAVTLGGSRVRTP